MKRSLAATISLASLAFVAGVTVIALSPARGEDAPGLGLFKKSGCNECHSISALGIEKDTKKKAAEPAATETDTKKKKKDAPDLSGVGLEHEAKWISAFLNKEETLDGEKHEKRFKGTEAERRTIAMWLGGLKTEPKKASAAETPAGEPDKDKAKEDSTDGGN
jgi:hypothetical protein